MLDINRPTVIKTHKSGARVAMYKDSPGVFLDIRGRPVSEDMARNAGFDVDRLLREKSRNEKLREAKAAIDESFGLTSEENDALVEADGRYVKHIGGGRYGIFDQDGNRLVERAMTKDEANRLLGEMSTDGG